MVNSSLLSSRCHILLTSSRVAQDCSMHIAILLCLFTEPSHVPWPSFLSSAKDARTGQTVITLIWKREWC